jgi:hypothetical protein
VIVFGSAGANRYVLTARRLGRRKGAYRLSATPTADGLRGAAASYAIRLN